MKEQIKIYLLLTISIFIFSNIGYSMNTETDKNRDSISNKQINTINPEVITLQEIIKRVLGKNPELPAFGFEIKAKEGIILQKSLHPVPELGIEIENFAGSGETNGFRQTETTLGVSREILLGGKRKKRMKVAELDKTNSYRDYDIKLVKLILDVKKRFINTLHIQKKLELRKEMVLLSEKFSKKITVRIKAGNTSPAELIRAKIDVLRNVMIKKQLEKEYLTSKFQIAALWGSKEINFKSVEGNLEIFSFFPKLETFKLHLLENAGLKRLLAEIKYRKSILLLEKSKKIPDAALGGGIRRLNESGSMAFTFSFSIPIPLSNINKGEIKASHYLLKKAESKFRSAEFNLSSKLNVLYEQLKTSYGNTVTLKMSILPKTLEMLDIISKGYELGKFNYLNVLDAFRTQLEVKTDYFESLSNYWDLIAELESLTGFFKEKKELIIYKKGEYNE